MQKCRRDHGLVVLFPLCGKGRGGLARMRCLLRGKGIGGILRNLDGDGGLSRV